MTRAQIIWMTVVIFLVGLGMMVITTDAAHAQATFYDCTDFPNISNATCTGDVLSLTTTGQAYDSSQGIKLSEGDVWYVSFVASGSGTGQFWIAGDVTDSSIENLVDGITTAVPITAPSGNSWTSLIFRGNSSFSGDVETICVTMTEGECEDIPPEPPATTTATSTLTVVHNPTLDMFLGIVLFFFVFVFIVWFFRRPYDTY